MKNFLGFKLIFALLVFTTFAIAPQARGADKYSYGKRSTVILTSADSITIEPNNLTLLYAALSLDTNAVILVDADNSIVGDNILLYIECDDTDRTVTWGGNVMGIDFTLQSGQQGLYTIVYTGAVWVVTPIPDYKQDITAESYNDTTYIETGRVNMTIVTETLTGNTLVVADDSDNIAGDQLILKLTASGANRQVDFSTNFVAVDDSVVSAKIKTFSFIYDGTNWLQTAEIDDN